LGEDLTLGGFLTEPGPDALARLARLHAMVGRMAEEAPKTFADP
jgi:hypothetical protein